MPAQEHASLPGPLLVAAAAAVLGLSALIVVLTWAGGAARIAVLVAPPSATGSLEHGLVQTRPAPQAEAEARLQAWHWVDREAGLVALPVDEAMDLVAAGHRPAEAP